MGVWLATFQSGVHATIAGVALGLATPAVPFQRPTAVSREAHRIADDTVDDPVPPDADAHQWLHLAGLTHEAVSPLATLEHPLHPWTSYVIVPLFALANAGVSISGSTLREALTGGVTLGVVVGLVVGKTVGVTVFTRVATRTGSPAFPMACAGASRSGSPPWPGSGSPSRCSSPASRSRLQRTKIRPRSASWPRRYEPDCSAHSCLLVPSAESDPGRGSRQAVPAGGCGGVVGGRGPGRQAGRMLPSSSERAACERVAITGRPDDGARPPWGRGLELGRTVGR